MANTVPAESSAEIRKRVMKARAIQQQRFQGEKGIYCNAQMNSRLLRKYAWPDEQGLAKLKDRMDKLDMSARAFDRILRVARTVADLEYAASLPDSSHSASDSSHAAPASDSSKASAIPDSRSYQEALAAATSAPVLSRHITEAIGYRSLDRGHYGKTF